MFELNQRPGGDIYDPARSGIFTHMASCGAVALPRLLPRPVCMRVCDAKSSGSSSRSLSTTQVLRSTTARLGNPPLEQQCVDKLTMALVDMLSQGPELRVPLFPGSLGHFPVTMQTKSVNEHSGEQTQRENIAAYPCLAHLRIYLRDLLLGV